MHAVQGDKGLRKPEAFPILPSLEHKGLRPILLCAGGSFYA